MRKREKETERERERARERGERRRERESNNHSILPNDFLVSRFFECGVLLIAHENLPKRKKKFKKFQTATFPFPSSNLFFPCFPKEPF